MRRSKRGQRARFGKDGAARSFRDPFSDWPFVMGLGLYDARSCPFCGTVVCHTEHRRAHMSHHIDHNDLKRRLEEVERAQHILNASVRRIATLLEIPFRSATDDDDPRPFGDDEDDDDWHDDRLTRHARRAAQATVYEETG